MIRRVIFRRNNHNGECLFLFTQQRFVTPSSGNNRPATSTGTNSGANPADEYFSFTPDPKKPIDVLDAVLNTVSKRYGIPTNATDMRIGTIGAYRALGVLMQQYVTFLEKEGPSSPSAHTPSSSLSSKSSSSASSSIVVPPSPLVSSLSDGGVVAPKEGSSEQATQAEEKSKKELARDELRKASFTSIVSFLVRTLFSKHATPMETQSIADAINKQAEINRRARQKEFLDKLSSTAAEAEVPSTATTSTTTDDGKEKAKEKSDAQVPDKHSSQLSEPSSSSVEDNIKPEDIIDAMNKAIGSKGQAIVERHFPMTNNMRNLLNNFYHMPTHKMVPVLGSAGKGLGKEFRDYFAGGARVSLRFGKFTAGLYPAPTLPPASQLGAGPGSSSYLGVGGAEIGTLAELTNVFEISHPRDNVIRASINAVRVDGTIIEASADEPVILDPIAYAWRRDNPEAAIANGLDKSIIVDKEFFEIIDKDVGAALNTLDRHRPKKSTTKTTKQATSKAKIEEEKSSTEGKKEASSDKDEEDATKNVTVEELAKEMEGTFVEGQKEGQRQFTQWVGTSPNTKPGSKIELASYPHVSVDILMEVIVPPRRFVPDYEFYEERVIGGETQGQRNAVAKMLAIHSATRFTRFANKIYKMFTGKELKIDISNNTTIDMLARRTGMDEIICVTDAKGNSTLEKDSDGNVIPKYPYESKIVTMVYCFKDKEWAVDNVKVLMNGSYN